MNLTSTLNLYSLVKSTGVSLPIRLSLRFFWLLSLTLLAFSLAVFVIETLKISQSSYLTGNYKENIKNLSREVSELEIQAALNNSVQGIEALAKASGFEPVQKVYYIEILKQAVLTK